MPTDAADPPRTRAAAALVALLGLLALELVRSSGPLLDMAFTQGVVSAAGAALATYLAPGLVAAALLAAAGSARARRVTGGPVLVGVVVLAVLRLVVQGLTAGARFGVGLVTVAVAVAVLVLAAAALAARAGGGAAARAVAVGLAADVGLQLCLGTWDAYWRHDALGWAVTVALVAAAVGAAWLARSHVPDVGGRSRLWTLGPALGLAAMVAANPAFAAAQTSTALAVAGPALGLGWLLAAATADVRPGRGVVEAVALPLLVAGVMVLRHPAALVLLVALPPVVGWVLARALAPRPDAVPLGPGRAAGAGALAGVGVILPLLVYQLDYDVPLPVPNWIAVVAGAAALGAAAVRRTPGAAHPPADPREAFAAVARRRRRGSPLAAAVALVVLGTGLAAARAVASAPDAPPTEAAGGALTLLDWNLHYGVSPAGDLGLEQIARTIEAQHPDVVTLQEVSRGWVMGGGADAATWLAERLGMRVAFAPAADAQFGNAVLTALPLADVAVLRLPYGEGPQRRSALSADVGLPGGPVRVTSVHLQHRDENTATRLDQLRTLLDAEGAAPVAVIAGDLNAEPGWPEVELMTGDAGMASAIDVAGDPAALTYSSGHPFQRIDWVFGRGVTFLDARVVTAHASDHLPVVVELRVEAPAD